jgi:hypothetical protein
MERKCLEVIYTANTGKQCSEYKNDKQWLMLTTPLFNRPSLFKTDAFDISHNVTEDDSFNISSSCTYRIRPL